jgi:HAD superfamily hydrolase (TIGR01484 family)
MTITPFPSQSPPKAWRLAAADDLHEIRGVCLDIDETLSTRGKLTADAYSALWALKEAGFAIVPITGRPAGWCDHIARFWPVDAVVGENGAFSTFMQGGVRRQIRTLFGTEDGGAAYQELKLKLQALCDGVRSKFPHAKWASDQAYREWDLAIDICEDVPAWEPTQVEALLAYCLEQGAHAKLSSIHVNTWFGDYDKLSGFQKWLQAGCPGVASASQALPLQRNDAWLFIGDSPNDEPLFAGFKYSVGVANLKPYLERGQVKRAPIWITDGESGAGFSDMARKLVASRQAKLFGEI